MNQQAQRLRQLAARTGLDGIAEEMRAIADELDSATQPEQAKGGEAVAGLLRDMEAIAAGSIRIPAREYAMHALADFATHPAPAASAEREARLIEQNARKAAQEQLYAERERHTAEVKRLQAEIGRLQAPAASVSDEDIDKLHDSMFPPPAFESARVEVRKFARAILALRPAQAGVTQQWLAALAASEDPASGMCDPAKVCALMGLPVDAFCYATPDKEGGAG